MNKRNFKERDSLEFFILGLLAGLVAVLAFPLFHRLAQNDPPAILVDAAGAAPSQHQITIKN